MMKAAKSFILGLAIMLAVCVVSLAAITMLGHVQEAWADEVGEAKAAVVEGAQEESATAKDAQAVDAEVKDAEAAPVAENVAKGAPAKAEGTSAEDESKDEPEKASHTVTLACGDISFVLAGKAPVADVLAALGVDVDSASVAATAPAVEIATVDGVLCVIAKADATVYLNVAPDGASASIDDTLVSVEEEKADVEEAVESIDETEGADPAPVALRAAAAPAPVARAASSATMEYGEGNWIPYYNDGRFAYDTQMVLDGEVGFCLDFRDHVGWGETYYSSELNADDALRWGMYYHYFYTADGEDYSYRTACILTQYAIWWEAGNYYNAGWAPDEDYDFWNEYDRAVAFYNSNRDYFEGSGTKWTSGSYQAVATSLAVRVATGSLSLTKASANPACTDDNPMYSLEGTTYGVYATEEAANARGDDYVHLFEVNEDGTADEWTGLHARDTYWVAELTAGPGYVLDNAVRMVTIAKGSNTISFTDAPINDPNTIKIVKEVENPDLDGSMGAATLALAEYTFEYYAADYETADEAQASGNPDRTWVMRTDEDGYVSLIAGDMSFDYEGQAYSYKVSGDDFYRAQFGTITLPLGTIVVFETKAPEGFELSDEVFFARLMATADGGFEWIGEKVFVDPQDATATGKAGETIKKYGVEIYKQIQGVADEASPEGIQFEIVSETTGEVVATLTLDENGKASMAKDALVYDTYIIREIESTLPKSEDGEYLIQPYSETSGTGSNVIATLDLAAHEALEVIHVDCVDYASEHATGKKLDSDTDAGVPETEFTIWKLAGTTMTDGAIAQDETAVAADDGNWVVYRIVWSDENGDFDFGYLPYGIYKVDETSTNVEYMTSAESAGLELDADTSRIFKLDKNNPYTEQVWLNKRIVVECNVDKSTIEVTSAGLEYKTATDGEDVSNVGVEKYKYEVAFDNGDTNTFADEYWVVDQMNFVPEPYGLRMTDLWLPVVVNDKDGKVWLLWKTNLSDEAGNVPEGMTFAQPEINAGSLCDGTMRFDASGWMLIGQYDATSAEQIDLASLLAEGEYITSLALCYGAVDPGFTTVESMPLTYLVTATHALPVGTVIPNTAESHISRNWAKTVHTPEGDIERDQPEGLTDDDEDFVETRVIDTFTTTFTPYVGGWGSSWYKTGDEADTSALLIVLIAMAAGLNTRVLSRKEV